VFAQEISLNGIDAYLKAMATNINEININCMDIQIISDVEKQEEKFLKTYDLLKRNFQIINQLQKISIDLENKQINITYPLVKYLYDIFYYTLNYISFYENNISRSSSAIQYKMISSEIYTTLFRAFDIIFYFRIISNNYPLSDNIGWSDFLFRADNKISAEIGFDLAGWVNDLRESLDEIKNMSLSTFYLSEYEFIMLQHFIDEKIDETIEKINFGKTFLVKEEYNFHISMPIVNVLCREITNIKQDLCHNRYIDIGKRIVQLDDVFISLTIIYDYYPITVERSWEKM
jgi:hypothetical protein